MQQHYYLSTIFIYFSPSHLLSSPFCSLSLLVVTQIRGHIAGSSSPPTHYGSCLAFFIARGFQLFLPSSTCVELCFVDLRRIVLTHARRSQQLFLSFIFANKFKISPRRDWNSRTNTSSIRGLPLLIHRGDRLSFIIFMAKP